MKREGNAARPVSVSRLKARLSEYLTAVRNGRAIIVTDRGRPAARIDPVTPADDPEAYLATLAAAGLACLPNRKLMFTRPRVKDPGGRVLKALLAERDEGR